MPATSSASGSGSGGSAGSDGSGTIDEAGAAPRSESDWCAARTVLEARCQRCHGEPQKNGAPFPLLTYADTLVVDRAGTARFEKMKAAIETDYMPPQFLQLTPAVEPLSADERATLLSWLTGAPPLDATCD